jgi:peptidoglycan hydrolase-like protein with peptidoglycan-binding domain
MKPRVISAVLGVAAATLTLAGIFSGTAPGAAPGAAPPGATTMAAVAVTGQAGAVRQAPSAAPAYTAPKRLLKYGLRGSDVKALQQRLAALKYYPGHGGGVPLSPVSHGCVRIPYDIAQFFHALVKTPGTPVYIY